MVHNTVGYITEAHFPLCCQGMYYKSHCLGEKTEARRCELTWDLFSTGLACLWGPAWLEGSERDPRFALFSPLGA